MKYTIESSIDGKPVTMHVRTKSEAVVIVKLMKRDPDVSYAQVYIGGALIIDYQR